VFGLKKSRATSALQLSRRLEPGPRVSVAVRDGRAILMDLRGSSYYGLDDVGTRIWGLLIEGRTPAEIFDIIELEYDGAPERLRADGTRFLNSLLDMQLVTQ
jgi:hypothetical protein